MVIYQVGKKMLNALLFSAFVVLWRGWSKLLDIASYRQ